VLPRLIAEHPNELAERSGCTPELMARLGVMASYYLRYYYAHDAVVREQKSSQSRACRVAELESELLELYADPALDTKPDLLQQRGGAFYSEAAVDLVASLLSDRGDTQVVNVRNSGTLPFLAGNAVVEVPRSIARDRDHRAGSARSTHLIDA
jgi:6-phospho-beta-glucosidase